jgi:DNA-binding NarL/FixJ family response regulator
MSSNLVPEHRTGSELREIRILIVDDHPLLRDGIAVLIAGQPDMEVVGQASSGREGIELFRRYVPDITLMDLQMPDISGIDAIIAIRETAPLARFIVLTTYAGDAQVMRAIKAGAQAFFLKNVLQKELLETIRTVHAGRKTMSPSVASDLAEHSAEVALTAREIDVLRLIAAGHANKEIAAQLSTTEETVKSRVKHILMKLNASDRTHAAMIGLKRGIIDS